MKNNNMPFQNLKKEDIELAYHIAAKIVTKFGDVYLPVFERIHRELEKHIEKSNLKAIALKITSQ